MFADRDRSVQGRSGDDGDLPQARRPGLRRRRSTDPEGPRRDAAPDPRSRRRRLLQGPGGARDRRLEQRRQRPHHRGRPRPVHDSRAGTDRVRLPRLSHRLGAAAELGRGHPLRDPQRPRGLSAQGLGLPLGAGSARADRGDAPRLRRPQQLPRRSRLRQEPARPPPRQGVRGEDSRRDRSTEGGSLEGPEARRRAARRQQHHALLDRRRQRATPSR
jgi:hypothetical protein